MCGIFGFVNRPNVKGEDLLHISQLMKHRGPDDEGFYAWSDQIGQHFSGPDSQKKLDLLDDGFQTTNALVHRRLSIQDLSTEGHQPMSLESGRIHIVFNGEIYNFKELAQLHNLSLRTGTDTEVILKLYQKLGLDCFKSFRGMWALAILDLEKNQLILSRDRFGIKPLHYSFEKGGLAFSSEIKPLLHLAESSASISEKLLLEYISFGVTADPNQTFFSNIECLQPGTILEYDIQENSSKTSFYYQLGGNSGNDQRNFHDLFESSIDEHLVSDVEVGSCLSGGLDSSLIVSSAAQKYSGVFKTYTCSFPNEAIDESQYARQLGKKYTSVQQFFNTPTAEDFIGSIEKLVSIHERPIGSASIYAQYAVMQSAAENGAKVLLDGQGADEVFGGYYPFAGAFLIDQIKSLKLPSFLKDYRDLKRNFNPNMAKAMIRSAYYDLPKSIQLGLRRRSRIGMSLLNQSLGSKVKELSQPNRGSSDFKTLQRRSIEFGLYELLQYEDRNAMAFSIETRVPFLDHRLVEWALKEEPSKLMTNGWTKYPLRKELDARSLKQLAWRKDKLGFVAPQERWMKESIGQLKSMLISLELPHVFDRKRVNNLFDQDLGSNEHLSEFWRILSLIIWMNKFKISVT